MKIIFSGTPQFSIPTLDHIYKNYDLIGIITKPDMPSGRGLKIKHLPVKKYAMGNKIPLYQPDLLTNPAFIAEIKKLEPDFIIDLSYGKILPEELISIPKKAAFNIHPSYLPGYRGASPIRWVLINSEEFTGVSSHLMTREVDKGKIIHREKFILTPEITYNELHHGLSQLSSKIVTVSIDKVLENNYLENPGDEYKVTNFTAGKIQKSDCLINWKKNSQEILSLIKGIKNKPTAFTYHDNIRIKIYEAEIINDFNPEGSCQPGEIALADKKSGIIVKTGNAFLKIIELQKENKKRLNFKEFLNGTKLHLKEQFHNA